MSSSPMALGKRCPRVRQTHFRLKTACPVCLLDGMTRKRKGAARDTDIPVEEQHGRAKETSVAEHFIDVPSQQLAIHNQVCHMRILVRTVRITDLVEVFQFQSRCQSEVAIVKSIAFLA